MAAKSKIENRKAKIRIGCQGWNYDDWTTRAGGEFVFYPRGTRAPEMLALYAEIYETIEVDSTFYAIPPVATVEGWYKKAPEHFTFSLKLPQEITHEWVLREGAYPLVDEFCERAAVLREKLGVVLVQLAPQFEASKENAQALREFLAHLPRGVRFAVEFRHRAWMVDWTFEELAKRGVALALVEGQWIPRETMLEALAKAPADFAYVRFMGERDLTRFDEVQRPMDANLRIWKEELERIAARDVFVYFSNFYEGFAPASVDKLKTLLGQPTVDPRALEDQGSLF